MSVGTHHHRPNRRHREELEHLIADPSFQKMWARPFRVVTSKQIPDTAGYNVAGSVFYIDRDFYNAVLSHRIVVPGMTAAQIIRSILVHERTEKAVLDSDNAIEDYSAAHEFATMAEHLAVTAAGGKPNAYEDAIRAAIKFNEKKPLTVVPADLDAEPYVDEPDAADKVAIAAMVRLGVVDAGKISKLRVKYAKSTGADRCIGCVNWMAGQTELAPCRLISGAVRRDRVCSKFAKREGNADGKAPRSQPQRAA